MSASELSRQRVAFIAGTLGQGGAEKQLYHLLQILTGEGAACAVFSLTKGEYWEEKIRALGVPVYFCGQRRNRVSRIRHIYRSAGKFKPTIIQSHLFYTNAYAAIIARLLGIFSIGSVRDNLISEMKACGYVGGKLCLYMPDGLLVNSQQALTRIRKTYPNHNKILVYLPNVLDVNDYSPSNNNIQREPDHGDFTILGIGRLDKQKRFDRFFPIVVELRERTKKEIVCVIAGDGPLRKDLERQAYSIGLDKSYCRFLGMQDNILSLYRSADVLLLTSEHEGTPNVVMEAMSCGLPVVTTAVGDAQELFPHDLRWLVIDPYSPDAFASVLETLYRNPELRRNIGRALRAHIVEKHSIDALRPRIVDLYRSLCRTLTDPKGSAS